MFLSGQRFSESILNNHEKKQLSMLDEKRSNQVRFANQDKPADRSNKGPHKQLQASAGSYVSFSKKYKILMREEQERNI